MEKELLHNLHQQTQCDSSDSPTLPSAGISTLRLPDLIASLLSIASRDTHTHIHTSSHISVCSIVELIA